MTPAQLLIPNQVEARWAREAQEPKKEEGSLMDLAFLATTPRS